MPVYNINDMKGLRVAAAEDAYIPSRWLLSAIGRPNTQVAAQLIDPVTDTVPKDRYKFDPAP